MMGGYIMAQRNILAMFEKDPAGSHLYSRLLTEAAIADRNVSACGQTVRLKRGELVFGRAQWADKTGISPDVIRRIIKQLLNAGEITQLNCGKFSIVSITSMIEAPAQPQHKPSINPAEPHSYKKEKGIEDKTRLSADAGAVGDSHLQGSLPGVDQPPAKMPTAKGTRWVEGATLPDDWLSWAKENTELTEIGIRAQFEQFSDYWVARPGQKGVKANWKATWRSWLRSPYNQGTPAVRPGRVAGKSIQMMPARD